MHDAYDYLPVQEFAYVFNYLYFRKAMINITLAT